MDASRRADGRRATARPAAGAESFAPNPFPYDLAPGTEHWVFWMASAPGERSEASITSAPGERSEASITSAIAAAVDARGGGDFVWYYNPKPSVPDPELLLSHVQVFWQRGNC